MPNETNSPDWVPSSVKSTDPAKLQLPSVCQPTLQTGKLQRVLAADLKVAELQIPDDLKRRLIQVVQDNLDAFAASPSDHGETSAVCRASVPDTAASRDAAAPPMA